MKKHRWLLVFFVVVGMLAGSLAAQSLEQVPALKFLTDTVPIVWSPAVDLAVVAFDFTLRLDISLLSILGIVLAIWLYRRL
ncbi:MAG: hypothetical protein A9Z00_07055 [Thermobacillus sp. ZCTH02-B1]|uniref:DUF4321 domain-containing protein n=1 Tax=Thermobacillus sp. ZCTH02-B1 TaxID=1858795 RepID=UPI000B54BBB8|nr:DUF4321 domain-containing protein [Thermobacillus sp. ZCTH02-B1]OUM96095.1 MAG: hypothetical protein A9Z00_07055 [Thermobacillus sp. ZCTH02-B1]